MTAGLASRGATATLGEKTPQGLLEDIWASLSSYSLPRRPRDKGWPPGRGTRKLVSVEKLDNAIVVVPVRKTAKAAYGRRWAGHVLSFFLV